MENKIAIVGSGHSAGLVADRLLELGHENVHIIEADQIKDLEPFPKSEPIIYSRPKLSEIEPYYITEKQFKCKGKHQYRESNGNWVCECGRKL